jgi:thiamine biosynthesis lipoprotein
MKKLSLFLLVLGLFACTPKNAYKKVSFSGMAQGTYYAVTYFDHLERDLQAEVDSLLRAFDMSVSMWEPSSIISRINRGEEKEVPLDSVFIKTYLLARQVAEESGGAFDYTVGPLVNAWGFGFEGRRELDSARIDSLLPLVNYELVRLEGDKVIKGKDGIMFDFNAVAQGYSVDLVGELLASKGIDNYLVDIGGEVLAVGEKPLQGPWIIGIERPSENKYAERSLEVSLELKDLALATSGNYRKFYEEDGIRYSHTIDPKTGHPVTHTLLSVSVIAGDCGTADAWATAFMVMGLAKAKSILEDRNDLHAYFIYSDEKGEMLTYATEGMKKFLKN